MVWERYLQSRRGGEACKAGGWTEASWTPGLRPGRPGRVSCCLPPSSDSWPPGRSTCPCLQWCTRPQRWARRARGAAGQTHTGSTLHHASGDIGTSRTFCAASDSGAEVMAGAPSPTGTRAGVSSHSHLNVNLTKLHPVIISFLRPGGTL